MAGEKFCVTGRATASGADRSLLSLRKFSTFEGQMRGRVYRLVVASPDVPTDRAADFYVGRTTAPGFATQAPPVNLDDGGPSTAYGGFSGTFAPEPDYVAGAQLLGFQLDQRATFEWEAEEGCELLLAASGPNPGGTGCGLKTVTSTGTQSHKPVLFFME